MKIPFRDLMISCIILISTTAFAQGKPSLQLTTSTDNTTSGEPIDIKLVLTNTTNAPISVPVAGAGVHAEEDYEFNVQLSEGHSVSRTALGKAAALGQEGSSMVKSLEPDETSTETTILSKFFDTTLPGSYKISASRKLMINGVMTVISSNSIVVKVTP